MTSRVASDAAIGIDLGTVTCAAARFTAAGELSCFLLEEDRFLLPSALYFGEVVEAGEAALRRLLDDPEGVVEAFKRDMGQPHFHREVRGAWTPPEVLSGMLLDAIRRVVQRTESTRRAVITVPAYFDERRRKATLEAGRLAGLEVIDIVNEPVAAALAELHFTGRLSRPASEGPQHVLVYDLGGGTFDVSVLRVEGQEVTTLASDGDVYLGGRDFDMRIVDYVSLRYAEEHGLDPRTDFTLVQRLRRVCERAKHELSDRDSTRVECDLAGKRLAVNLTRARFVELIAPLLERTLATSHDAVEQAGLTWSRLDQVLLVGGSSRIPAVADWVRRETGIEPTRSHNPDLSVARGAALLVAMETAPALAGLKVVNVNAHSLGVAGVDPRTGERVNRIIIPRNSRLPADKRQKFVTKSEGQRSIRVDIVEGENENPEYCVPVGTCVVTLAPNLPARTEVLVTCRLGTNGTLSVSCLVPETNQSAHVEIRRDGLMELEGLDVWRKRLLGRPEDPVGAVPTASAIDLPYAEPVEAMDGADLDAVARRADYLCQSAADLYAAETLAWQAEEARQQWRGAERERRALAEELAGILGDMRLAGDADRAGKLREAAARARLQLAELENLERFAKLAFGGMCLRTEPFVADAEALADELDDLGERLRQADRRHAG